MVLQVKSGAINFSFKYFCQWFVEAAAALVVIPASFCRDSVASFTRLRDNAASSSYLQMCQCKSGSYCEGFSGSFEHYIRVVVMHLRCLQTSCTEGIPPDT